MLNNNFFFLRRLIFNIDLTFREAVWDVSGTAGVFTFRFLCFFLFTVRELGIEGGR